VLALLVRCHQCGREFPSEVSLGADGVHGPLSDGVLYSCPHCGTRDPYFTAEHYLPGARGFAVSRSSAARWWGAGHLSPFGGL
jgi:DNA-directed RNA polymerase subunit RPC12/RpoP